MLEDNPESDRSIVGEGLVDWRLFGIIPVAHQAGADVNRAAAGRLEVESIWLPSVLIDIAWTTHDESHISALLHVPGHAAEVHFHINERGALKAVHLKRWGDPDGWYHHVDFGGHFDTEATFGGYTIPATARVGWFFGSDRFESEGEFWRNQITSMTFR